MPQGKKRKFKSKSLQGVYDKYIGDDPEKIEEFEAEYWNSQIAKDIYELRQQAGLSQRELAEKVGTQASVICRLEDADYDGHSLSMLRRIAMALDQRVEIRFVPVRKQELGA